jgi:hypothetical protein
MIISSKGIQYGGVGTLDDDVLPYTDLIDEQWADEALESLSVMPSPDDLKPIYLDISGRCPRCSDDMEYTHWLVTVVGVASMSKEEAIEAIEAIQDAGFARDNTLPAEFTVECECETAHPDPKGRKNIHGCGAKWRMRVEHA